MQDDDHNLHTHGTYLQLVNQVRQRAQDQDLNMVLDTVQITVEEMYLDHHTDDQAAALSARQKPPPTAAMNQQR